ncbi:unnamed protein product [Closterium sp. NIES-65]|nr:unnamed protein product [Closterium sp. NIES-65]
MAQVPVLSDVQRPQQVLAPAPVRAGVHVSGIRQESSRQLTRQRAELAAFFYVGMNTFTDREWGTGREDPRLFDPAALNATQWVDTVKAAGFQVCAT